MGFEERSRWIPAAYVGHSSTARELAALQCAAEAFRERVAGRRLRVVMDSRAAVCNLTKEGGPVRELCAIVKEWARWCEHHDVRPVYEWVPREENKRADALSRVHGTAWQVREGVFREAERRWGPAASGRGPGPIVCAPDWAVLAETVRRCELSRALVYVLTPDWVGQSWWLTLTRHERAHFTLTFAEAYESVPGQESVRAPGWGMRVTFADFRSSDLAPGAVAPSVCT